MDPNVTELVDEARRLSELLDKGLEVLREQSVAEAEAEHAYRRAKATAWVEAPEGTVPERDAWVDGQTADQRRDRDLARAMRRAAKEAVQSRRQQISLLQSALSAHRSEAEFAATGPEMGP